MARGHSWRFFRAGGVDQVRIEDAADIEHLATLDQKLWVALACPTKGIEFDERTLALVDTDHDERIRAPEILAAIAWSKEVLKNLGDLFDGSGDVPLTSIRTDTAAGRDVVAGAKLVLANLGKADAKEITLDDVSDRTKVFAETTFNGDGIVPADSAEDDATKRLIEDVITALGSVTDRSGKPGIDQKKVDAFFDQAAAHSAWLVAGAAADGPRLLGAATDAAAEALGAVRAKIDDYFVRCRLAAFDTQATPLLNPSDADVASIGTKLLTLQADDVAKLPIARIEAARALPLADTVNPAWAERAARFASAAVMPLLGGSRTSLAEKDYTTIKEKLAPFDAWMAVRPVTDVAKLGDDRVAEIARSDGRAIVSALIAKDAALESEAGQIEAIERLSRYRRDLVKLLHNFVNFADFYGKRRAVFQAGTLYLDARSCDLCLSVDDVARHAALAGLSEAYLAYCDCARRPNKEEKRTIVAAFTGGDTDNLMAGRNGVFYDRRGNDWDATITKIVENPISVRQAFWSPYKRFIRLIEGQISKRAQAADDESRKKMETTATSTANADKTPLAPAVPTAPAAAPEKPEEAKGLDVGTVAAIGVAVGGLATFLSSIFATFFGLGMWMPVGLLALLLAISGPSMLISWLKLRHRNIGPILDANGWAVNAMARINVPFGGALTGVAALPPGASRSLRDPFAEKKRPWGLYMLLLVIAGLAVAWFAGVFDPYLPPVAKAARVFHRAAEVEPSPGR